MVMHVAHATAAPEGTGNVWTWTAKDADHKMILAYEVDRSGTSAIEFKDDLCGRLARSSSADQK